MIIQTVKHTIGIEIGQTVLRLVYLRARGYKQQLLALRTVPIEGVAEADLVKHILDFVSGLRLKKYRVATIVPASMVITKNIEVPSTSIQEIREIVSLQAGRHTPYSREEVIVSHLPIGVYKKNYTKILMIIMNAKVVKKQLDLIGKAGLKVSQGIYAAETLAAAAARLFKLETGAQPAGLVHIDRDATDFLIISRGKLLFVRSIPVGRRQLNAEGEKAAAKFSEELKKSLEAYQGEDIEKAPAALYLLGAAAGLDLAGSLQESVHLPVRPVDYPKTLALSPEVSSALNAAGDSSFLNCISAAFFGQEARIDLIPEDIQLKKRLQQRGRDLLLMGILILGVFSLVVFNLVARMYHKSEYSRLIKENYARLRSDTSALEKDLARIVLMRNYLVQQGYSLEVLTALVELLPPDMEFSDIRYDDQGKLSVKGTASAMSTVFTFVDTLAKNSYFSEVKTKYTTKRKEEGKDVVDFELAAVLKRRSSGL